MFMQFSNNCMLNMYTFTHVYIQYIFMDTMLFVPGCFATDWVVIIQVDIYDSIMQYSV